MRADARIRRGERNIYNAVITAMTIWLDTTRQLILGQPVPALTAAADDPIPDIDAAQASFAAWARALENHVEPAIAEAFGEAFAAQSRAADISPVHFQEHHMATVHDRLKIWPEGAFEELRPELLEAMQQNESIEQITDRIGRILDIDAPSRRIRADISAIDAQIADPATDRDELPFLRGKRRRLWNQHDESQQQWKWLARRIARTECLPADSPVNAANITAVYRRHYEGQWIEVHTASGRKIAGTPNHPVLTASGWKGLAQVTESDHLVCYLSDVENVGSSGDQDVENTPATIGEIFNAVAAVSVIEREAGAKPDFHGDGREGYVDVLRPDWLLRVGDFSTIAESRCNLSLSPADHRKIAAFAERSSFARDVPVPHGVSLLKVSDWDSLTDETSTDSSFIDPISSSKRLLRNSGHVEVDHLSDVDVNPVDGDSCGRETSSLGECAQRNPGGVEDVVDSGFITTDSFGDSDAAKTGIVELDNVIRVDVSSFSGHVFNVTTVEGYYSGPQGIVTSNTQGAMNAGSLASAQATAELTGQDMYKAWLATADERTRHSHSVADGQIVKLAEPFRVGVALLPHPAFPGGPAHEVIQCRCSLRILTYSEMQAELQGLWGGRGVSPMGARLGPDDEADAATAIDRLNRERRGEVLDPIERTEPEIQDTVNVDDDVQENPQIVEPDDEPFTTPHDDLPDLEDDIPDDELHVADEEPDLDTDDEELPDHPAVEGDPTDDSDNETEPEVHQPDPDPADIPEVQEEPASPPAPTESVILEPIIETTPTPEPLVFGDLEVDDARRWASRSWPLDRNSFDPEVSGAVTQYTGDFHDVMNEALRGGFLAETSEANQRMVANLRRVIDEAPRVPEPVHVFREVSSAGAFQLQPGDSLATLLGRAFDDLGFMSTSLTQATAGAADLSTDTVMVEIAVPAGYAAIYVSGTTSQQAEDILSAFGNAEVELILKDGTTIVITDIEFDSRGRPILQAEVIDIMEGE